MRPLLSFIAAASSLLPASLAFNCSIPPMYFDIHHRAIHGTNEMQYGSFLGMGTPAQNLSLWPSLVQNETSVASEEFCNQTGVDCRDFSGGIIDVSDSSRIIQATMLTDYSWKQDDSYQSADLTESTFNASFGGRDTLYFYTHYFRTDPAWQTLLPNFPFTVATKGSGNPGINGMGQKSTMLHSLFDAGMIAGRTYSLYIGNSFNRSGGQAIGSNTAGGYDPRRFTGAVHNYSMIPGRANPLGVRVTDIILDDPMGITKNVSLLNNTAFPNTGDDVSSGFDAEITTDQFPFSLPYEVTENYKKALAAVSSEYEDGSLRLSKPFNGTMTIVLSDGFKISMPPEMMFNVSGISPVADRAKDSKAPFVLGSAWLTQVYLMLDYEAYAFYLAQAIPLPLFNQPQTWCPRTAPQGSSPQKAKGFAANGLIGAVLGGLIGGVAMIGLAWWLFVFWTRKQMIKAEREAEEGLNKAPFEQLSDDGEEQRTVWKELRPWKHS